MNDILQKEVEFAVGIDIGGTKVKIAVVDPQGRILRARKEPVEKTNIRLFIDQLYSLFQEALLNFNALSCRGVGVALPAVIAKDNDTITLSPNLPFLDDSKLKSLLIEKIRADSTGDIPVVLGFDGTASVIAEAWQGEGRNSQDVVTVAIGTGIGGGLMLGGKIITGYNNVAGAIGWSRLGIDENTPAFEDICSGPGISKMGRRVYKKLVAGQKIEESYITRAIFDAAEQGEESALAFLEVVIRYIGTTMANLVSLVNPEVIVFTGSVGLRLKPYLEEIRKTISRKAQPVAGSSVKLTCSQLGDNAGVTGAAGLILFTD